MKDNEFCYRCNNEVQKRKNCEGCYSWLCEHCYTVCQADLCPERGQKVADWYDEMCAMCLHEHNVDDLVDLIEEVYAYDGLDNQRPSSRDNSGIEKFKNPSRGEQAMVNESVSRLINHKAQLMRNSQKYRNYLRDLMKDLGIADPVEAALLGAVDAMIYDLATALDFTKQKGRVGDWSSYASRRAIIKELWGGLSHP